MALSLTNLVRKASDKPPRLVIYGKGGIGKTTLANEFPNPIFIQTEDGGGSLKLTSFTENPMTKFSEVEEAIELLYMQDHEFKTVVLDSITKLEPIIWAETCRRHNWASIEDSGYGKGYVEADAIWRYFFTALASLREKGMTTVILGHEQVEMFSDPEREDYSRYRLRLHKRAEAMAREEADVVGFLTEVTMIKRDEKKPGLKTPKATGSGQRVLNLQPRPTFEAKNRFDMPTQILINPGEGYTAIAPYLPGHRVATAVAA